MGDPAMDQTISRRDRLKQEREVRILDAAATVFAAKGFHQATIRDIAELADVADGTIYNYFEGKFDLLIAILARVAELEELPGELTLQSDLRDFFVTAFSDRLARIEEGEEMLKAVLPQVFVNPELRGRFYHQYVLRIAHLLEGYIQAQIESGRIRAVDPHLLTRLIQATFVGLLVLRILGDDTLHAQWDQVAEFWAASLFEGLDPRDGG